VVKEMPYDTMRLGSRNGRHCKRYNVWVPSHGCNYGRWEASCWPSHVNRSCVRKTSKSYVEFNARHAFAAPRRRSSSSRSA
jgi:hypothetical protein